MNTNQFSWKTIPEGIAGAAGIGATILLSPALRGWYTRWGATPAESAATLPGDETVPNPKSAMTLAVTVQAPPEDVWPWFVQLGCQRAGWYSYDLLDNGGVPSAEQVLPEHQSLAIGDVVKAMPQGDFGFPVAAIEPEARLTLAGTLDTRSGEPADPGEPDLEAYFSGDQSFYLQNLGNGATRLIFRMRLDWNPSAANTIAYRVFLEPISFRMARKTMLNVKRRAERLAAQKSRSGN
jgi:hypothetical protein